LTPEQARKEAHRLLGVVKDGGDPAASKAVEKAAPTVRALSDRFMAEHVTTKTKARTAVEYRRLIENVIVPGLGGRRVRELTRADVSRLHHATRDTPCTANRALAVFSKMLALAEKWGERPDGSNPCRHVERFREDRRERFLTTEELTRLGDAIREGETIGLPYAVDEAKPEAKHAPKEDNRRTVIGPHAAAALRLLILTGARLREILHLRWEHVDFERGMLLLPDSKTGKKAIVLNAPALDVLASLPRVGVFVIAGQSAGAEEERPRHDLKRPWQAVSKRAGLNGVRIHDLRHTHASVGAAAGLGLPIIGKLLGHTQASTTARYAHLDADPLRRASDRIGGHIAAAMGDATRSGDRPANVVSLRHRGVD
jgi:integrase